MANWSNSERAAAEQTERSEWRKERTRRWSEVQRPHRCGRVLPWVALDLISTLVDMTSPLQGGSQKRTPNFRMRGNQLDECPKQNRKWRRCWRVKRLCVAVAPHNYGTLDTSPVVSVGRMLNDPGFINPYCSHVRGRGGTRPQCDRTSMFPTIKCSETFGMIGVDLRLDERAR